MISFIEDKWCFLADVWVELLFDIWFQLIFVGKPVMSLYLNVLPGML